MASSITFIGDPHVGNFSRHGGLKHLGMNRRCEYTLQCVRDALEAAWKAPSNYAVILGDLLDSMRPEPQLLAELRKIFRAWQGKLQIIILKGNHDSASDTEGDTALYAIEEPNVMVVDQPRALFNQGLVLVPFRSGHVIDWLPGVLEKLRIPPGGILCLHAGIKDENTSPWLKEAPDAIEVRALRKLMKKHQLDATFAGNWHDHQVWPDAHIYQLGALCPTGFSNIGGDELYGHVRHAVRRTPSDGEPYWHLRDVTIPGPRFYKIWPAESPFDYLPAEANRNRNYIEWKVAAHEMPDAREVCDLLKKQGLIEEYSVLPDTQQASQGLKRAAKAAQSATGIDEAIHGFVERLSVPQGCDRNSIRKRVRTYVGL